MNDLIAKLQKGIIVSCHADEGEPFNTPDLIAKFALSAQMGGASAVRIHSKENVSAVRKSVSIPIIGLVEGFFENGAVCITPDYKDVEELLFAGADMIALDATPRKRPNGIDGVEFFEEVRSRYDVPLIADISIFEEGVRASEMGASAVATTLSGYTEYTGKKPSDEPDYTLIEELARTIKVPVFAEGRVWTVQHVKNCIERGAYAIVIGAAISRPSIITQRFVLAIQ